MPTLESCKRSANLWERLRSQRSEVTGWASFESAKSTLPHHSAPAGATQVSLTCSRVTWLQFHSQREIVVKKICLSTQLCWQNVTSNAMLQLAVIACVLKSMCPYLQWGEKYLQVWPLFWHGEYGILRSFGKGKAVSLKAGLADPVVSCLLYHSFLVYRKVSQFIPWQWLCCKYSCWKHKISSLL